MKIYQYYKHMQNNYYPHIIHDNIDDIRIALHFQADSVLHEI